MNYASYSATFCFFTPQLFAFLLRNFRNSAIRYNNFIFVNAATLIQHSLDIPSIKPRSNGTI